MNTSATKKVTLGSLDNVLLDVSSLYTYYFDHSLFIEGQIRNFVKEFETKRGDADITSLKYHLNLFKGTEESYERSKALCSHLETISADLAKATETIRTFLPREAFHQEQRDQTRKAALAEEKKEKDTFLSQQQQTRAAIDKEFNAQVEILKKKYEIRPIEYITTVTSQTTPSTPSVPHDSTPKAEESTASSLSSSSTDSTDTTPAETSAAATTTTTTSS